MPARLWSLRNSSAAMKPSYMHESNRGFEPKHLMKIQTQTVNCWILPEFWILPSIYCSSSLVTESITGFSFFLFFFLRRKPTCLFSFLKKTGISDGLHLVAIYKCCPEKPNGAQSSFADGDWLFFSLS